MPYEVRRDTDACSTSKPWAVVNPDSGRVHGCHESKEQARRQQAALYRNVPDARGGTMQIKTVPLLETQADPETGTFTALASVFGNVDVVGDRMLKGAFKATLAKWRASGDPIPVILSHKWDDPWATIGQAEPRAVYEDDRGLVVQGTLDMENPLAKQVHKLMQRGLLKGWSFGYTVPKGGQKRENGANEINQVELVEVGPTLKGANPEAQLQAVKSGELQPDEIDWSLKQTEAITENEARGLLKLPPMFKDTELAMPPGVYPVNVKQPAPDSATMASLMSRMRELMDGDPPSPEAMLAFASRVQNELGKADTNLQDKTEDPPRDGHLEDDTALATDRVEGGKAVEPRPRDPLKDKFDRILLGLE